MSATYNNKNLAFGNCEPKPLKGFPEGRVKLKIRNNCFTIAFVKTPDGIREFYVMDKDGFWMPCIEKGRNLRLPQQRKRNKLIE